MGHEYFTSVEQASGPRPAAVLARRLLETGQVDSVHIYSNMITVDLNKGYTGDTLSPIIEDLYTYYREGFVPPPLEMPAEEASAASPDGAPAGAKGGGEASRVPADLLERSRVAKERWLAKQGGG
jgi:hypothetical protein